MAKKHMAKKHLSIDYLPARRKLELKVPYMDQPHPSTMITTTYELLEDIDPGTETSHHAIGNNIYTDGSKIEGKTGAALTWWDEGREKKYETFSLDPSCTVFQSELYALYRAVKLSELEQLQAVNIWSDSRSSLDLLANSIPYHPLAKKIKESLSKARSEGRHVNLYWLRSHVGTPGNERADELAKSAAIRQISDPDYGDIPLSHVKKKIREESIQKWQDRYDSSNTGSVTKAFFPDVAQAYRIIRKTKLTYWHTQILTGHGGTAEYLHRFQLKENPSCECDPDISETIWHILKDCPRYQTERLNIELATDTDIATIATFKLMTEETIRPHFLAFSERVMRMTAARNKTEDRQLTTPRNIPETENIRQNVERDVDVNIHIEHLEFFKHGERGSPVLRTSAVALYMKSNTERLGIAFCNVASLKYVTISPGLAGLLNGSTFKTTLRRKTYEALRKVNMEHDTFRILRTNNKVVALFEMSVDRSAFTRADWFLKELAGRGNAISAKIISVDAMAIGYTTGHTEDWIGVIKASTYHEVVAYENRGENLSFLLSKNSQQQPGRHQIDGWGNPIVNPEGLSGSELLQQKLKIKGTVTEPRKKGSKVKEMLKTLGKVAGAIVRKQNEQPETGHHEYNGNIKPKETPSHCTITDTASFLRSKADMGIVEPPLLRPATQPLDHIINAFLEFEAINLASIKVKEITCQKILQAYLNGSDGLATKLEAAEAAVYNNDTLQILKGQMSGKYMAAFSGSVGFVKQAEAEDNNTFQEFTTPPGDPLIVVAKCTRILLEPQILLKAKSLVKVDYNCSKFEDWMLPKLTWINGVPGCGKTSWIVNHVDLDNDIVITTTTMAAKDLLERMAQKVGNGARRRVRTMASILVNGLRENETCRRIIVDEALMNHFGAVVMAIRLSGAEEALMVGDNNQLPYIDRDELFRMHHQRPNKVASVSQELLCTHRNPMDVAYALNEVYGGIYSSRSEVRSLIRKSYRDSQIPMNLTDTLYLVYTQAEKKELSEKGYGGSEGSQILTIHESQGLTSKNVVIIRTATNELQIHRSIPHAVVAISRHTQTCTYYTDCSDNDAIARFIARAAETSEERIKGYNLKMAIRNRDWTVMDAYTLLKN